MKTWSRERTPERALSVAAVENDFVEGVTTSLQRFTTSLRSHAAPGPAAGNPTDGNHRQDRVLEVGVGTGINLSLYPRDATVTGIDFSSSMLEKARERAARKDVPHSLRLVQMDAADLKFADDSFDIVYAPYLISVVPIRSRSPRKCAGSAARAVESFFSTTS